MRSLEPVAGRHRGAEEAFKGQNGVFEEERLEGGFGADLGGDSILVGDGWDLEKRYRKSITVKMKVAMNTNV